jgi:hypothetical protein
MKKYIILLVCVLLFGVLLTGCEKNYSKYPFTDVSWTRDAEQDIETIRFGGDGSFSYYCSCGNSVNDSDLCEDYSYDDETKIITLDCYEITDEMVTTIKLVKCDDTELHLDFDGEIRIFTK